MAADRKIDDARVDEFAHVIARQVIAVGHDSGNCARNCLGGLFYKVDETIVGRGLVVKVVIYDAPPLDFDQTLKREIEHLLRHEYLRRLVGGIWAIVTGPIAEYTDLDGNRSWKVGIAILPPVRGALIGDDGPRSGFVG